MSLHAIDTKIEDGLRATTYLCDEVGDGIPLHSHLYNHITEAVSGEIEVYTDDDKTMTLRPGDPAVEWVVGRAHGIRALAPGATFRNTAPDFGGDA